MQANDRKNREQETESQPNLVDYLNDEWPYEYSYKISPFYHS